MRNRKLRQAITAGIAFLLLGTQSLSVYADTAKDLANAKSQRNQTSASYHQLTTSIGNLEKEKNAITEQISDYEAQLVVAIATVESLEEQLKEKAAELEQTEKDLAKAEEQKATEYDAMKQRIQYLYETGGEVGWAVVLLEENDISTVLEKAEYAEKMYKYDRDCLEHYADTLRKVQELKEKQEDEKANLEVMKNEQEENKQHLEDLKAEAQEKSDNYAAEIASAEQKAAEYQKLIAEQNSQIQKLEQKKAEEDAAREAARKAEEARQKAAKEAERQRQQQAAAAQQQQAAAVQNQQGAAAQNSAAAQQNATGTAAKPAQTTQQRQPVQIPNSGLGSSIAAYGCQFVGNPYVYGGNSLTNGIDCSGFVQQVMAHFGIRVSRTSYTQAYDGVGVSYGEMQPGDVICYGGHVAIYIGNNQIVHASNPRDGIKISSNPAYRPIVAIRRMA